MLVITIGNKKEDSEWIYIKHNGETCKFRVKHHNNQLRLVIDDPDKKFKFVRESALRLKNLVKAIL